MAESKRSGAKRTRIKICGITRPEDARDAADAGADAIGLVFYAASRRAIEPAAAVEVCAALPPLVSVVALFVDPDAAYVERVLAACTVDLLQFHGSESDAFCARFRRPWIKAVPMRPGVDVAEAVARHPGARALLFDAWREDMPGGTGETFDWQRLPKLSRPWLLAGGLDAANVGDAVIRLRPPAVDVSGGVESAPGIKDRERMMRFTAAVRAADQRVYEDAA